MKINMAQSIMGFNGEPIVKSEEDNSPVTLGDSLIMACVNANPQTHTDPDEKVRIYRLMQRIHGGGDVELEAEDIVLLKTLVGESFGVGMVGPVFDILENPRQDH